MFLQKDGKPVTPLAAAVNILLVAAAVTAVFWLSLAAIEIRFDFSFLPQYGGDGWPGASAPPWASAC